METVVAVRDGPDGVFGLVLGQADWARAVIGLGQPPAVAQNGFRVGIDCRPIEAHHSHGRLRPNRYREVGVREVAPPCISPDPAAGETRKSDQA